MKQSQTPTVLLKDRIRHVEGVSSVGLGSVEQGQPECLLIEIDELGHLNAFPVFCRKHHPCKTEVKMCGKQVFKVIRRDMGKAGCTELWLKFQEKLKQEHKDAAGREDATADD
jgi:hypothetical protein